MERRVGHRRLSRLGRIVGGWLVAFSILACAAPAEAHRHRHVHRFVHAHSLRVAHAWRRAGAPWSPAFSALLIDANSGGALYAVAEDGLRHPASITKVMTLYLLFEQLESGAMTLQTRIPVSQHAAAQEPSKLGVEAGDTISVDEAIKAIVTRSANDIAVAVAEAIGGDESGFADMMTKKAHALGMSNTVYRNASGLPNDEQVTTARDQVILARSLEDRFPRFFKYFSTQEFAYDGELIGNHNHLLGRVDGLDGIKTGYTRASGFNLLASVHRDGRSLIGVVFGGRSAPGRDRIMENMIEDHIAEASSVRSAPTVAEAPQPAAEERPERSHASPVAADVPARAPPDRSTEPQVAEGDDGDEAPLGVASIASGPERLAQPSTVPAAPTPVRRTPAELGWRTGPAPAPRRADSPAAYASAAKPKPPAAPEDGGVQKDGQKNWIVQIGATDDKEKAEALIKRALQRNRSALAAAKPVTEKVRKGDGAYYRARFAGLNSSSAELACRSLKRNGFSCFAARD